MINAILTGIFNIIISLVNILLSPIDALIAQFVPSLDSALTAFSQALEVANDVMGFVVSATGLSDIAIDLVIAYWVFALTVPIAFRSVKLAIKWYNNLKI